MTVNAQFTGLPSVVVGSPSEVKPEGLDQDGAARWLGSALSPGGEHRDVEGVPEGPEPTEPSETAGTVANPLLVVLAATLTSTGASYLVGSVFRGGTARTFAVLSAVLAGALIALTTRMRRPSLFQYLLAPAAVVGGLVAIAPYTGKGSSGVVSLVLQAVRDGGLSQPPATFDPGWRFLIVVFSCFLCGAAATLALTFNRPRLAVLVPIPVVVGAALIQPPGAELGSFAVAAFLIVTGLAVSQGAALSRDGGLTLAFEARRLGKGAVTMAVLIGIFAGASQFGFLFPEKTPDRTVPPTRPTLPPPISDRVLFTVKSGRLVPLRLGVIDEYVVNQSAWMLPPFNASQLKRLATPATLPAEAGAGQNGYSVTVTVDRMDGHGLPTVAGATELLGVGQKVDFDPRSESLRLADRPVFGGLTYTLKVAQLPNGRQLAEAPAAPAQLAHFLIAPPAPALVKELLTKAPQDRWDRLQYLRQQLYTSVVAAGAGRPTDVSADRVVQMLQGKDANPYEIVAAEALLARWAGVPSRMGYGYYGGDPIAGGQLEVHPRNGSVWLEVYFKGYGWLPVTGVPPKAKPSLSNSEKNQQNIRATNELGLQTLVLVAHRSPLFYFDYARYWLARVLPGIAVVALLLMFYPGAVKQARSWRRRRWARSRGPRARVLVAYAAFRDRARDLAVGNPVATPLEFLASLESDAEHEELAWLVTRGVWGDLRRDLREEDAEAAEQLALSLTRRFSRAQLLVDRILAVSARSSLKDPFLPALPNVWWSQSTRSSRRRRVLAACAAAVLVVGGGIGSVAVASATSRPLPARSLPAHLVPSAVGDLVFTERRSAESAFGQAGSAAMVSDGQVFTVSHSGIIEGAVQLSVLKRELDLSRPDDLRAVFHGIRDSIGNGRFVRTEYAGQRYYRLAVPGQRVYAWFPLHGRAQTVEIVLLRTQFGADASDAFVHALIDAQLAGG